MLKLPTSQPAPTKDDVSGRLTVRALPLDDIDDDFVRDWETLESRVLEGNMFRSPHFVLPALRFLRPEAQPIFLAVELSTAVEHRLLGLGIFEHTAGSRLLPLPHLKSFLTIHSFLDGILVDRDYAAPVVETLFDYLSTTTHRWHGISFAGCSADTEQSKLLKTTAGQFGALWFCDSRHERCVIQPADVGDDFMTRLYSRSRRKVLQGNRKKFGQLERSKFHISRNSREHAGCAETFLKLENMGWKGDALSSLQSNSNEAEFFRKMTEGFARTNRSFFSQLSVDGETISSISSFVSGTTGFTFKIGWHPDYAGVSPGTLNNFELLAHCRGDLSDLQLIDSCSNPGSSIEKLWPWRRKIEDGVFVTSRMGHLFCSVTTGLKKLKRSLKRASD